MARQHHRPRPTRKRALFGGLGAAALTIGAITAGTMLSSASASAEWPTPGDDKPVSSTQKISGVVDGKMRRYIGEGELGDGGQDEGQPAMFELADGATLKNVVIGSPAADGIHCKGSCTLQNVWWEDVGEDAATFLGGAKATYTVTGGGARKADDKVFQHNGGGTLTIRDFAVQDFGKLYRSCGNCSEQQKRAVVVDGVEVTAPGKSLVGVNENFGDTAKLSNITIIGDTKKKIDPCVRFKGNDTGAEPEETGSGPDAKTCLYKESDISYK